MKRRPSVFTSKGRHYGNAMGLSCIIRLPDGTNALIVRGQFVRAYADGELPPGWQTAAFVSSGPLAARSQEVRSL